MSTVGGTNGTQRPHSTMIIEWSNEGQTYSVSIAGFPGSHTLSDTYEEAVKQGEDLIDSLIMWMLENRKPLPEPRVFAVF